MKLYGTIIIAALLSSCMAKPKQPELTEKEKDLIDAIMLMTGADTVHRELYPNSMDRRLKSSEIAYYGLSIYISCEELKKEEKLKKMADQINMRLKGELLTKDFEYNFAGKFDEVLIDFVCSPVEGLEKAQLFEFK